MTNQDKITPLPARLKAQAIAELQRNKRVWTVEAITQWGDKETYMIAIEGYYENEARLSVWLDCNTKQYDHNRPVRNGSIMRVGETPPNVIPYLVEAARLADEYNSGMIEAVPTELLGMRMADENY